MHLYSLSSFSILICLLYVQSQILYECNFDNATLNETCFTTGVLLLSNFAFLTDLPLDHPASDVTSALKPTNNGQVCRLPYNVGNYAWDMYFCYKGYCPTENGENSTCAPGQYAAFQLRDNATNSLQLKTELNNISLTSEQYLIYYYYISNIGQKSITIIKEVDGTNETIDFVTSSPFNGWIKREIPFNATESGYKIYFDLQKTSSETSLFHIALDEISIRQVNADDQHTTTDLSTTITTSAIDIVSSSLLMSNTSMSMVPDISTNDQHITDNPTVLEVAETTESNAVESFGTRPATDVTTNAGTTTSKTANIDLSTIDASTTASTTLVNGNFIIFENYLTRLESLTLIQSQQLINIIEYLYNCRIIHRDLRPDNLMLDLDDEHIKLIDFGFATTYENDEMSKTLPIEAAISYGCLRFLKHYHNLLLINSKTLSYVYERIFDLQCAINIMMYITDDTIKKEVNSIKTTVNLERKVLKLQQLWIDQTHGNANYSKIL
ncbi:unnamed protein product [Rotaria magnacalcarata]|uniref:Protein kinase domain-containing protein n=2 Tax=Rotaria magnacalcarata TaxID=392030 RepID=A0A816XEC1_9BILA|nr:unnamed protein product [Rotaria magnacalcarata]